jgi:hypothetical protein
MVCTTLNVVSPTTPTQPTAPTTTTTTTTTTTPTQTIPCKLLGLIDVELPQDMCGIAQLMAIGGAAIGGLFVLKIVSELFRR